MASSTGIVVTAGAITIGDIVLSGWNPQIGIRVITATVLAALIGSGIDRVMPGLGTGLAVILLTGVLLTSGVRIARALNT